METLSVPDPRNPTQRINFDFTDSSLAEARVGEISIVTSEKAPELLTVFCKACFALGRVLPRINLTYRLAQKRVGDRRAVVVVDQMAAILKDKGLASNETSRQSILDLDSLYSAAVEAEMETEAVLMYVERKLRDMEGALNALKSTLRLLEGSSRRANPNLTRAPYDDDTVSTWDAPSVVPELPDNTQKVTTPSGGTLVMGRARY